VRAIQESDLALTPNADGTVIRLNIPALTADRRKDLVKMVKNMAEESRVAIRNVRRDIIQDLKELKKEGEVSEDEEHRAEEEVQKLTDGFIEKINDLLNHKEEEILEI
jgi:ribosome recycling factor